jgi:hypothetical protein
MTGEKERLQHGTAAVFAVFVLALIVSAAAGKLPSAFGWWAGCLIGVAFHELGHLMCAFIAAIPVHRIVIGAGPLLWRSHFGDGWLQLRVLPLNGRVEVYPLANLRMFRWAFFLIGGVLGNLAVICIFYGLHGSSAARKMDEILGPIMFMQVLMVIGNIIPLAGRFGANDGMRLLRLLQGRDPGLAFQENLGKIYSGFLSSYGKGNAQFTMTTASSRLVYHVIRFHADKEVREEAREGLLRELDRGDLSREEQMCALDILVTDGLASGDVSGRPHLDAWSQQALALGPDLPTLQSSRGAVLIDLGRYEEGKALLTPMAAVEQPESFISRMFLALAEHRLGNETVAQRYADAARATAKAIGKTPIMAAMLARLDSEVPPAKSA